MDPVTQHQLTVYGIPVLVLAIGGALGWALTSSSDEADAANAHDNDALRTDLLTEKATALAALRDLETERSRMAAEDYDAERRALLQRGAAALKALDEGPAEAASAALSDAFRVELAQEVERLGAPAVRRMVAEQLAPAPTATASPASTLLAWGALAVVVIGLILNNMQSAVGDRGQGPLTGRSAGESSAPSRQSGPSEADLQRAVFTELLAENPADLEALNSLTELELSERRLDAAMGWNQQALATAPSDPEARCHHALLSFSIGMTDLAFTELDEVIAANPDFPRAWTYKGLITLEAQRYDDAVIALTRATELQPDNRFLAQQLAMAKRAAAGEPMPSRGDPQASGAPQGTAPSAPGGPPTRLATVALSLADGVTLAGSEVLFVIIKNPARPGPPLGAKKLAVSALPLTLELTTADLLPMAGRLGGVPDPFVIEARIDADGNATTKDLVAQGRLDGVPKGAEGLSLVLK